MSEIMTVTQICAFPKTAEAHLDGLSNKVKEQQNTIKELVELIKVADCPQCKDKSGAYYDNYGEVCQCQWCDETEKLIKSITSKGDV